MTDIDQKARPTRNPEMRIEKVDSDLLAYHPQGDRILQLNETAAMVWGLCDGQRTVKEISRLLEEAYPEDAAQIHADLPVILKALEEEGCIRLV
jgi:pyrroloquinoline quinone biosynthesis protein D